MYQHSLNQEVVYHNTLKELESLGVLFCDTDTAVRLYPDLVKKYFGKVVPYSDNKYATFKFCCMEWWIIYICS